MYNEKKIIAIIPARSGSKGLKDKNIRLLNNKPLISYTIEAARECGFFDCIFVSTDSLKYAKIVENYGVDVPFLRSSENANDCSSSWDVVREVISKLDKEFDIVVLLQPTSPLRTSKNIKEAVDLFFQKNADSLFSICETSHSMFWCNTIDETTFSAKDFIKKEYQIPRQNLPKSYTINGAVYIVKTENLNNLDLYSSKSFVYIMNKKQSIDIDDELDFQYADLLLKKEELNNV